MRLPRRCAAGLLALVLTGAVAHPASAAAVRDNESGARSCRHVAHLPQRTPTAVRGASAVQCDSPVTSIRIAVTLGVYRGHRWHWSTPRTRVDYDTSRSETSTDPVTCSGQPGTSLFVVYSWAQVNGTWLPDEQSPVVVTAC